MLKQLILSALLLGSVNVIHADDFKGNWTKVYKLKKEGHFVIHKPDCVILDGFITAAETLTLGQNSNTNGLIVTSACGLHLATNSTQEEFEKALKCSGLY